jgi:hypothetical protein
MKPPATPVVVALDFTEGMQYVGQTKTFTGPIVGKYFNEKNGNLYLNFDRDYKNNISIKIGKSDLSKFPPDAAGFYTGKTVIATGRLEKEKNYVRLNVTDPKNLVVVTDAGAGTEAEAVPPDPDLPATAGTPENAAPPAAGAEGSPAAALSPLSDAPPAAADAPAASTAVTDFPAQYGAGAPALSPRSALPAPTPRKFSWSSQPNSNPSHKKKGSRGRSWEGGSSSD